MEKEVQALEKQVMLLEKETNDLEAKSKTSKGKKPQINLEQFKVSARMNLIPEEGAYMLIIDSKLPITSLVL